MVVEGVLEMFRADRRNDNIDQALLKSMIRMLMDLGIYDKIFLQPFLHDSMQLYSQEGSELCCTLPVPDYLIHSEKRLASELERCVTIIKHRFNADNLHNDHQFDLPVHVILVLGQLLFSIKLQSEAVHTCTRCICCAFASHLHCTPLQAWALHAAFIQC